MGRHPVFTEWKIYYCYGVNIPYIDLKIHTIPTKIPTAFFGEMDKLTLKFIWKCKRPRITTTIKKLNKVGRLTYRLQNLLQSYCNQNSGDLT